ncbi:TM2 domain-containing protein [Demequina oxidasica]|uniref:TM2 domain-containing protein n=1 Tax=Demequina oxidasica TaxID=676199 RepID=UPI0022A99E67|nr:TM2 domain-containing protein [Demequina oxidasica]
MATPGAYSPAPLGDTRQHSFLVTWLFAWILGYLGVDRFYLGKIGTGILKLITVGGFGIWYLIDVIMVLVGATRDKQGQKLAGYESKKSIAWIVTIAVWLLGGFAGGVTLTTM